MTPLPKTKGVDYKEEQVKVSITSTINLRRIVYSVPSQLIGERLRIHLYNDRLECYLGSAHAITLERLHLAASQRGRQINYRHLIASLARKPMAFYHAELRDDILPNDHWRQLWQQCSQLLAPRQASYLTVGVLELAATNGNEADVAIALQVLLDNKKEPSLLMLQKSLGLASTEVKNTPEQNTRQHDLSDYDDLLKKTGGLS
jgi:hypothetical protein